MLVFFVDILVYNPSWDNQLQHLRIVLSILLQHHLFPKRSKCLFAQSEVAYLGHTVSHEGVMVDNTKILAAPLTNLLRKNCFKWSHDATIAFEELKKTLTTTPILTLPYFSQPFVVECDSSDMGIGAILQQDVRPISFYSHTLA